MDGIEGLVGFETAGEIRSDLAGVVATSIAELQQRVTAVFDASEQRLKELADDVTELADQAVAAAAHAKASLHAAAQMAVAAAAALDQADADATHALAAAEAAKSDHSGHATAGVEGVGSASHAGVDNAQAGVHDLTGIVDGRVAAVAAAVSSATALGAAATAAFTTVTSDADNHVEHFGEALDALTRSGHELLKHLEEVSSAGVARVGEDLSSATQAMDATLSNASNEAMSALQGLANLAQQLGGGILGQAEEVIALVDRIRTLVEAIRPVLSVAEQLA